MKRPDTKINLLASLFSKNEKEEKQQNIIKAEKPEPSVYSVSCGVGDDRKAVRLPLFENRIAIVGSSGSGKSVVSNGILSEIFRIPSELRIVAMIDMKGGIEIQNWIPLADGYGIDAQHANLLIGNIYKEMTKRQNILRQMGGKKLQPSEKFPLIILFIDELAEIAADKTGDKEIDALNNDSMVYLKRIFRLGRATGIVPIVALQRPDSSILSGDLKNNIETIICGKVRSAVDTKTIFGNSDQYKAHELSGHWFYFVKGQESHKFKTPYVPAGDDMAADWLETLQTADIPDQDRGKFLYRPLFDEKQETKAKRDTKGATKTTQKSENNKQTKKPGRKSKRGRPAKTATASAEGFGF